MKKASVAYQIFSARDEAQQDLYAVLKSLKEMGYDGVEFAGFYGHSAEEVRAMLDERDARIAALTGELDASKTALDETQKMLEEARKAGQE